MDRRAKLMWRSRRGIRELDLLLERFLERCFDELSTPQLDAYERLLEHPDQDILEWISGRAEAPDADLGALVRAIRGASD